MALTVGAGWMREQFELMGQDFANRGQRLDEMIRALPALWHGGWVSRSGKHYQIPELMLEPHPLKPIPIMCGGESEAALRRAARLCDGWVGNAYTWEEAEHKVTTLNALRRSYGRDNEPFDIMLAIRDAPSVEMFTRAEDIGVTAVMCSPWAMADDVASGAHDGFKLTADCYLGTHRTVRRNHSGQALVERVPGGASSNGLRLLRRVMTESTAAQQEPRPPEGDWLGTKFLRFDREGPSGICTLHRPEAGNATTPAMYFGISTRSSMSTLTRAGGTVDHGAGDVFAPAATWEGAVRTTGRPSDRRWAWTHCRSTRCASRRSRWWPRSTDCVRAAGCRSHCVPTLPSSVTARRFVCPSSIAGSPDVLQPHAGAPDRAGPYPRPNVHRPHSVRTGSAGMGHGGSGRPARRVA